MPWRTILGSKRLAMKSSGLLLPGAKTRIDHITDAAGNEGDKRTLTTSYELTKGGRILWEPKEHHEIPVLGERGKGAIKRGMQTYYDEMVGLRPDDLGHLERVHSYMTSELMSRDDKIRALRGSGNSALLNRLPTDPRLRKVVEEHLAAEHEALTEMRAALDERINDLKRARGIE
jgi:hypothetical protein